MLFSANARDNLRYGKWDATDAQIWDAARAANAESFLRKLPNGLDTYLGEGGTQLSGGQQQRVAIARALVKRAPLVLADEPTGNLDPHTGEQILDVLLRQCREVGSALVIVTHSERIAQACDAALRMSEGRVEPWVAA